MNKLKAKMQRLGLEPKKEYLTLAAIEFLLIIAGVIAYIFTKSSIVLLSACVLGLFAGIFYLNRYDNMLVELDQKLMDQFVESFTYFSIYISNQYNVYNALSEVAEIAKPQISPLFRKLLESIDEDKSLKPYLDFSSNFRSLEIKQVMLSVYRMVDEGGGDSHIRRFRTLFSKFSEERHKLERDRRKIKLESFSALPLIGSGLTMLTLVAALLQIMGSLYDVF